MEISGRLIHILKLEQGTSKSGKDWKKINFVIETEGQYSKFLCFSIFNHVDLIDGYKMGDLLNIEFNIESKEFNGKWFTNLTAYKISCDHKQPSSFTPVNNDFWKEPEPIIEDDDPDNDLPF